MSKTAEEIYEERLGEAVHDLIVEYFEDGLDYLSVTEYLEERDEDDEDFARDVYDRTNGELDDLLQRYLDY